MTVIRGINEILKADCTGCGQCCLPVLLIIYVLGKEEAEVELAMTIGGPSCHNFLDLNCNNYGMDG